MRIELRQDEGKRVSVFAIDWPEGESIWEAEMELLRGAEYSSAHR